MTPNMQSILDFLQGWRGTKFKSSEIAKQIGISPHGLSAALYSLADQRLIERTEKKKTMFWHCNQLVIEDKEGIAKSRTVEFKPMGIYNLKQHMDACEASRSLKNNGLI